MHTTAGWRFSDSTAAGLQMGSPAEARSRSTTLRRQSPGIIFIDCLRVLPVFLPICALLWRFVRAFLPADLHGGLHPGMIIITAAVLMSLAWALLLWLCCKWELTAGRIVIRRGIFFRHDVSISLCSVLSAEVERTPLTALAGVSRLHISTAGHQSDQLILSSQEACRLASQLLPPDAGRSHYFRADRLSLWLAAIGSEGLSAFYYAAAPMLSAVSDISGRLLEHRLTALIEQKGIVLAGTIILTIIWLLKVTHTRLTHAKMSISTFGSVLTLQRGVISRRVNRLAASGICAFDSRTSLPGYLLHRQSCSVLLPGEKSWPLLPAVKSRRLRMETGTIAPHGAHICTIRPVSSGLAYAAGRWLVCLGIMPLFSILRRLIPSLSATVPMLGITAAALLLWRAFITTISSSRAGLVVFTDCVELTGVRFLSVHTLRVFRQSTGLVRITQSPLARLLGRCTLHISPRGCRRSTLSSIKLPLERVLAVCERMM